MIRTNVFDAGMYKIPVSSAYEAFMEEGVRLALPLPRRHLLHLLHLSSNSAGTSMGKESGGVSTIHSLRVPAMVRPDVMRHVNWGNQESPLSHCSFKHAFFSSVSGINSQLPMLPLLADLSMRN